MGIRHRALLRVGLVAFGVIALYNFFEGVHSFLNSVEPLNILFPFSSHFPSKKILNTLSLNEHQCRATFPGLTKEIDDAVARGPFDLEKEPDDYAGLVQARIKDGKVRHIANVSFLGLWSDFNFEI